MGLLRERGKCGLLMHVSIPTNCISLFSLCVLSFFLFFLFFLSTSPSFCSSPFHCSQLPLFIPSTMVEFTIFILQLLLAPYGVLPRLPIGLPAAQRLPLLRMYWLHHSPFLEKIVCLVSYLSPFSLHSSR